jgi:hypothetical protein
MHLCQGDKVPGQQLSETKAGSRDMYHDLRLTSDNFLQNLKACVELRSLKLRAHVSKAIT